LMKGG